MQVLSSAMYSSPIRTKTGFETGGVVVGKTVKLEIDAEAVRPLG